MMPAIRISARIIQPLRGQHIAHVHAELALDELRQPQFVHQSIYVFIALHRHVSYLAPAHHSLGHSVSIAHAAHALVA